MRSARRWYWLSTSPQAAFTCSSLVWKSLYPQPESVSAAIRPKTHRSLRMSLFSEGRLAIEPKQMIGRRPAISSRCGDRAACEEQVFPRARLLGEAAQEIGG